MAQNMNEMLAPLSRDEQEALTRRQQLVDILKQSSCLSASAVEVAFRAVPRHLFLHRIPLDKVYADEAISTKYQDGLPINSSPLPAVMATMLEQLEVQAGHNVLEIGAGKDYYAALLATLTGEGGQVFTIDIDDDIVTDAKMCHLAAMGALAQQNIVPDLLTVTSNQATLGLLEGPTLCVLVRSAARSANTLRVRRFGPDEQLAEPLIEHLSVWERAGRPSTTGLRIRAYPQEVPSPPSVGEIIIAKRWPRLVLDWPS